MSRGSRGAIRPRGSSVRRTEGALLVQLAALQKPLCSKPADSHPTRPRGRLDGSKGCLRRQLGVSSVAVQLLAAGQQELTSLLELC